MKNYLKIGNAFEKCRAKKYLPQVSFPEMTVNFASLLNETMSNVSLQQFVNQKYQK